MPTYNMGFSTEGWQKRLATFPKCPTCKFHIQYKKKKEYHVHLTRCNSPR
jgi:hypothetical protein